MSGQEPQSTDHPRIVLILGDQLSPDMHALKRADPKTDIVLMAEVAEEATYVAHHKKKIAFVFSAMRHFAKELEAQGWSVDYTQFGDPDNAGSLRGEVKRAITRHRAKGVILTEPGEYRLKAEIDTWADELGADVECVDDTRFIASHAEFQDWAKGRKQLRMEYFYREIRKKTGLLMHRDQPEGGKWNFDAENRKPAKGDLFMPRPLRISPDRITKDVLDLVEAEFPDNFGTLRPFWSAVTREGAEKALATFIDDALPSFGDYQDAMLDGEPFLYHSVLSLYINTGLLDPLEVCRRAERAYYEGHAPLNAVEGFVRQIIGWREYIRGVYWLNMPGYTEENFFGATTKLPAFYWTGDTDMACMAAAIGQTCDEAYAHHIQRLMVTGNFAMLAGVNPHEVHEWYLAVYFDAYEWVEAPNVIGMSQFADGGLLGSKPYAASGNYINKMSDYCGKCRYDVKQKTGKTACPFNPLYWNFLIRNEKKLRGNPRLAQVYRTWDRMGDDKKNAYLSSADAILKSL
ncbi:cryptochrome/photolyase family protein [Aliiroseovarius sp. YM-037]|uniref:cryptochrome/photolyase family protein n=1 Tax=Aliiroseovarius sp. YM-037 TaxID=3341728 RepID=UPI003A7FB42F